MSLVKINWRPNTRELRDFGKTVLIGFLLIGAIAYFKRPHAAYGLWGFGAVVGGAGLTGLKIALPFYWAWMGFAFVMGNIMSRVLIGVIFIFVLTPLAFLMKLIRRDRLNLHRSNRTSYWQDIKPHGAGRKSYERQF